MFVFTMLLSQNKKKATVVSVASVFQSAYFVKG